MNANIINTKFFHLLKYDKYNLKGHRRSLLCLKSIYMIMNDKIIQKDTNFS